MVTATSTENISCLLKSTWKVPVIGHWKYPALATESKPEIKQALASENKQALAAESKPEIKQALTAEIKPV